MLPELEQFFMCCNDPVNRKPDSIEPNVARAIF